MYCGNCGNSFNNKANFCVNCGAQIDDNIESKKVTSNVFIFSVVRCIIELVCLILSIFLISKINSFYVLFINSIIYIVMASIPNFIIKIEKKSYRIANLISIVLYSIISLFGYAIYLNFMNTTDYDKLGLVALLIINIVIVPFYFCVNLILDKIIKK